MNYIFGEIKIRSLVGGIIIASILTGITYYLPIFKNRDIFGDNFLGAIFYVFILLWLIYMAWRKKSKLINLKEEYKVVKNNFHEILTLAILGFVFSFSMANVIPAVVYLISPDFAQSLLSSGTVGGKNYIDFAMLAIGTIILAPIVEEFIFRGVLLQRLSIKWGLTAAIFISSVLFGFLHVELAVIGALTFGITASVLYKKLNSICAPMVVHAINNAFAILPGMVMIAKVEEAYTINNPNTDIYLPGAIGLVTATIAGYHLFKYIRQNWPTKEKSRPKGRQIFLILDNIRSMENVGSIFRTADAAGVAKIYLCGITPKPPRKEIDKSALGAVDFVEWEYQENLELLISKLKNEGITIVALEQDNRSIPYSKFKIRSSCALIVGNETEGISKETLALCHHIVEIPMHGQKNSLNVAVATGIVLYDIIKK